MTAVTRRDFLQAATAATAVMGTMAGLASATATAQLAPASEATPAPADTPRSPWKKAVKTSILKSAIQKDGATWEEKITLAKESGYDAIEWDEPTTVEDAIKLQETARKLGTPCHGVVFGGWHAPLSDPDPAVVEKGLEGMRNAIDCARAMDTGTVLLVPAVVKPEVRYDEAYRRSQDNVRKLLEHAEKQKVVIGLENVWNRFLLSPLEFGRYIDEIGSPWVKAYFDVGNCIVQSYAEHWIEILGDRIIKIDMKDFSRKEHKFVPVGDGDVNFPEVKRLLQKLKYDDYVTSESSVKSPEELADSARRIDKVLA